jgi:hypothetical protein
VKDATVMFLGLGVFVCLAILGLVTITNHQLASSEERRAVFRARCESEGGALITSMSSSGVEAFVCHPIGTTCNVVFREERPR